MKKLVLLFCLALTAASLPAQLTVYPGDANNSHLCNHVDVLYLGLNFGLTGPQRNVFPNTTWTPQPVQAWGAPVQLDAAYSDCDGTGEVDRSDLQAIQQNFGLTHSGSVIPDTNSLGGPSNPPISINLGPDSLLVQGVTQFTLSVDMGSPGQPVDSIYGYALTIDYDPLIVDQVSVAFNPGSFAVDSAGLTFVRIDSAAGKIFISATNTDHMNRSGSGTIATIGIVMDDNIRIASTWTALFTPSYYLGFSAAAALVPLAPKSDTLVVITGANEPVEAVASISPNPANDHVLVRSLAEPLTAYRLLDLRGQLVAEAPLQSVQEFEIHTAHLPAGCYLLEVHAGDRLLRRKVTIQPIR